jgi:hypothetical protein
MANVNNVHGLRPLMRSLTGGPGAAALPAHKLVGDGTALFIYDVVKKAASGVTDTICVTAGTAAANALGVNLVYGAASTKTDHIVIPGNQQLFETQIDTIANADLDKNAALVAGAGSSTTHLSGHSANGVATTNTLDFHVCGLFKSPDNAVGSYARIEVTFNNSQYGQQIVGV